MACFHGRPPLTCVQHDYSLALRLSQGLPAAGCCHVWAAAQCQQQSNLKDPRGTSRSALACLLVPGLLLLGQVLQHESKRVFWLLQQQLRHQIVPQHAQVVPAGICLQLQHLGSKKGWLQKGGRSSRWCAVQQTKRMPGGSLEQLRHL